LKWDVLLNYQSINILYYFLYIYVDSLLFSFGSGNYFRIMRSSHCDKFMEKTIIIAYIYSYFYDATWRFNMGSCNSTLIYRNYFEGEYFLISNQLIWLWILWVFRIFNILRINNIYLFQLNHNFFFVKIKQQKKIY